MGLFQPFDTAGGDAPQVARLGTVADGHAYIVMAVRPARGDDLLGFATMVGDTGPTSVSGITLAMTGSAIAGSELGARALVLAVQFAVNERVRQSLPPVEDTEQR